MPTVNPSSLGGPKPQWELSDGTPAVGCRLFFYEAGTVSTKEDTYTTSAGSSANTNPVVLNSLGMPTTEIWFTEGQSYKVVYAPPGSDDPPSSPIFTVDNLWGINDPTNFTTQGDQWINPGLTPTYVSATSFTLAGDQTTDFSVGRRVLTVNTGGTLVYSTIITSVFGALTTVTVVNDSGTINSGLSAVSYGILSAANTSMPMARDNVFRIEDNSDPTKKIAFEASGITTGTTRTFTPPDESGTMQLAGKTAFPVNAAAMVTRTTNGAAAGLTETTTNDVMISTWDFDQTTSEGVQFSMPMPSSWNEGTITFVPYWTAASGTGTVIWGCRAVAISNDDVLDAAFGSAQTSTDTLIATTDLHIGPESAAITIAGTPAAGDWLVVEIYRDISDTLNADARLIAVTIFFTFDGKVDA